MKIAQVVGVHPEADAAVDQQLVDMESFLKPAGREQGTSMSDGGVVGTDMDEEAARQVKLALAIADALRELQQMSYTH